MDVDYGIDWEIGPVIAELRAIRSQSADGQQKGRRRKLPSQKALTGIIEGVSAALFPNRLGHPGISGEGIDYFVGDTLDVVLRELHKQVQYELSYGLNYGDERDVIVDSATQITRRFAAALPNVRRLLDTDIRATHQGDPAAGSIDEVLVCYPGIKVMMHHRLAHALYRLGAPLIARMVAELAHAATGIDIHPGAQIGEGFFIDHGTGVVIGESCIIGSRVRIYQSVTLGARHFEKEESGSPVSRDSRHPIVEDDVVIYAGATVLGRITIGRGSIIGGNVWVTRSVAAGSRIAQAESRTNAFDDGNGI